MPAQWLRFTAACVAVHWFTVKDKDLVCLPGMTIVKEAAAAALAAWGTVAFLSDFAGGWASVRLRRRKEHGTSMAGKVVVVTGGNAGIGLGTVRELVRLGATVVMCSRSVPRGEAAATSLSIGPSGGKIVVMELDLASFSSIRSFAERLRASYPRLHVLLLNGGKANSFLGSAGYATTPEGFEETIGVNFLGHFYLTQLLLPILRDTPGARVIGLTSVAALNTYSPLGIDVQTWRSRCVNFKDWAQYGQSKLAMLLFIRQLQRKEPTLLCLACHPGVVEGTTLMHSDQSGGLMEQLYSIFMFVGIAMRADDGWRNSVYLASTDASNLQAGGYYHPVGRLRSWPPNFFVIALQRLGALQWPFAPVRLRCEELWDEARKALVDAGAKDI
eukprot:TRINITY_DN26090_c0_g1_i1.p1 TRINITY_DN26090_c0_g1~~TRINITY_DN26090_c0_g1_i1.p1  ORF type:complete len:405 (-),score=40.95 TRINITY_DN26090_c0_g1_i1:150-1310(-)